MLNFMQAMQAMNEGKKVFRTVDRGLVMFLSGDDIVEAHQEELDDEDSWEVSELGTQDYNATDWNILEENLEEDQAYMYYDEGKGRWVSTTNPQKHKTAGQDVAVFELKRAI